MQLLENKTIEATPEACAHAILDVVPTVMRIIRARLRDHRTCELSVPQFRVLAYLNRRSGASLSELTEHIGLTLPSMSKMMDGLVERGLATRAEDPEDRRRVVLGLTAEGHEAFQIARAGTQIDLAQQMNRLSAEQLATVSAAMEILGPLFTEDRG